MPSTQLAPPQNLVVTHGPFWMTKTGVIQNPDFKRTIPSGKSQSDIEYDEWFSAFTWTQEVEESIQFWLGDLMELGELRWGEKYTQALKATEYAEKTLRNVSRVARAIPPERRRDPEVVPFSHHAEVAALEPDQQEYWLTKCEEEGLTREQLRSKLKAAGAAASGQAVEYWLVVGCSDEQDRETLAEKLRKEGRSVKLK